MSDNESYHDEGSVPPANVAAAGKGRDAGHGGDQHGGKQYKCSHPLTPQALSHTQTTLYFL